MTTYDQLQTAMRANPDDNNLRAVLADWLEGQGDPRGELLRITELLRRGRVPHRRRLEARLRSLLYKRNIRPVGPTLTNSVGMKLAWVPAGSFLMGSPENEQGRYDDEKQAEVVMTSGFYMSVFPVTQGQYQELTGYAPYFGEGYGTTQRDLSQLPVEFVSWYDAVEFCNLLSQREGLSACCQLSEVERLDDLIVSADVEFLPGNGYRLPTEAEWEYACRAGTTTAYCFGVGITNKLANYGGHVGQPTTQGTYPPNAFGLYDMHGNVDEWCLDTWEYFLPGGEDPLIADTETEERLARGGTWDDSARYLRSAFRYETDPGMPLDMGGIRCVLGPLTASTLTSTSAAGRENFDQE